MKSSLDLRGARPFYLNGKFWLAGVFEYKVNLGAISCPIKKWRGIWPRGSDQRFDDKTLPTGAHDRMAQKLV